MFNILLHSCHFANRKLIVWCVDKQNDSRIRFFLFFGRNCQNNVVFLHWIEFYRTKADDWNDNLHRFEYKTIVNHQPSHNMKCEHLFPFGKRIPSEQLNFILLSSRLAKAKMNTKSYRFFFLRKLRFELILQGNIKTEPPFGRGNLNKYQTIISYLTWKIIMKTTSNLFKE